MNSDPAPTDVFAPTAGHDELLAALVDQLTQALHAGEAPDVDGLAARHPEIADELRELWATMAVAQCCFRAEASAPSTASVAVPMRTDDAVTPTFVGEFELLSELGSGGMGVVYQARHRGLDRVVALKMVRQGAHASPAELVRFREEAVSAARLNHPHVVPVYEVGEHHGQPFFTMQYVAGTTLAARLADGPLPAREIAALMIPVCDAVQAAHEQGVLHRDLKPSNILIDESGRPLVTDFGLAKRVEADSSLTQTGAIIGTPTHMAPEQAAGSRGRIGPASDVYSLGVIIYQLLTGRPPLQGASPMETVLMVLEQEPAPPRVVNPRADALLEMIALRCLQKPQDLRYESAQALANDLRAYLADEPIAAQVGRLGHVMARWLAETHHAVVLQNWGLLWMWHSLVLLVICGLTNWMQWRAVTSPWPYVGLWVAGMGAWALIFWSLRHRGGPVTFIERQIAHLWAASIVSIALLFPIELLLGMPTLYLSPVLALVSGAVFFAKAGMLSGMFYLPAAALFAAAPAMALLQRWNQPYGILLFGVVSAACFFFPGLKYYRQASPRG